MVSLILRNLGRCGEGISGVQVLKLKDVGVGQQVFREVAYKNAVVFN